MMFAAADWFEILAALIFFLITGIAQWIQKRNRMKRGIPPEVEPDEMGESYGEAGRNVPPSMEERRPATEADWEREIRRLFEGERPSIPSGAPPPVLAPPTVSAPPRPAAEGEESFSWEEREPARHDLAPLSESRAAYSRASGLDENAEDRVVRAARLSMAASAYEQAANLGETVSARLKAALHRTETPSAQGVTIRRHERTPAANAVVAMLRRPETARQAILASMVLQPPKGMD